MPRTVTVVLLALASVIVANGPARSEDPAGLRVVAVDRTRRPAVEVVVAVPRSLSAVAVPSGAFTVVAGDEPLHVEATPLAADRLDIALVLDASVLQRSGRRAAAIGASAEFVRSLPGGARVWIVGGASPTPSGPTERSAAMDALAGLDGAPGGQLDEALAVLRSDAGRRPALVLLTAESSGVVRSELSRLAEPDVPLYAIRLERGRHQLASSELPGGGVMLATGPFRLLTAFDTVLADLGGQYRLSFRLPDRELTRVSMRVEWRGVVAAARVALDSFGAAAPGVAGDATRVAGDDPAPWWWLAWLLGAVALSFGAAVAFHRTVGARSRATDARRPDPAGAGPQAGPRAAPRGGPGTKSAAPAAHIRR